jgi:hypothetical protein
MVLNKKLKESIEQDIEKCEDFQDREGSEIFFSQLVSKYTVIDADFPKNLSTNGKATVPGVEYDYRPELKAVAAKLRMWLLIDADAHTNKQMAASVVITAKKPVVFISHRSIDKDIADMVFDFLIGTGIPREKVFCSSLPGNDINEKISAEVKTAIKNSVVNIAILSNDYYQSAYCLNEAGIMWFCDTIPTIPVALPEISSENMYGFLNNDYKIRRLNSVDDISYIYDTVRAAILAQSCKVSIVTAAASKLKMRYEDYVARRSVYAAPKTTDNLDISSNDEAVILYYILTKKVRKAKKSAIKAWMTDEELYDVNVDNAFDLLSTLGNGKYEEDVLELDIETFRQYSGKYEDLVPRLSVYVERQRKRSRDTFNTMWESGIFDDVKRLFISYIIDERITAFGNRWMAESQIENIKSWESKHDLDGTLSSNYGSCLDLFIEHDLVYESSWTSYGNPREYSLCASLKIYLFDKGFQYINELIKAKQEHAAELPF